MVKTTIYLDDDVYAALRGLSKRSSKSQAQLIRDALRAFALTGNRPPPPAGVGMFESGREDRATGRKEILKEAARSRQWRSYLIRERSTRFMTGATPGTHPFGR